MNAKKRVLIIGIEPELVDFSHFPGLNAEKVRAALNSKQSKLIALGYDTQQCHTDLGATAETVVSQALSQNKFDCVVIGAGIRAVPDYFLLFEKVINAVHQGAPSAKLCFNTKPGDTAEAVQRWI